MRNCKATCRKLRNTCFLPFSTVAPRPLLSTSPFVRADTLIAHIVRTWPTTPPRSQQRLVISIGGRYLRDNEQKIRWKEIYQRSTKQKNKKWKNGWETSQTHSSIEDMNGLPWTTPDLATCLYRSDNITLVTSAFTVVMDLSYTPDENRRTFLRCSEGRTEREEMWCLVCVVSLDRITPTYSSLMAVADLSYSP